MSDRKYKDRARYLRKVYAFNQGHSEIGVTMNTYTHLGT